MFCGLWRGELPLHLLHICQISAQEHHAQEGAAEADDAPAEGVVDCVEGCRDADGDEKRESVAQRSVCVFSILYDIHCMMSCLYTGGGVVCVDVNNLWNNFLPLRLWDSGWRRSRVVGL